MTADVHSKDGVERVERGRGVWSPRSRIESAARAGPWATAEGLPRTHETTFPSAELSIVRSRATASHADAFRGAPIR